MPGRKPAAVIVALVILVACGGPEPEVDLSTGPPPTTVEATTTSEPEPSTTTTEAAPEPTVAPRRTTTVPYYPTTAEAPYRPSEGPLRPDPEPSSSGGSLDCGGTLPPCWVMQVESRSAAYPGGGDPRIWNGGCYDGPCPGGSTASGKWQFVRGTWGGYGGYVNAADAPVSVQDAKARETWAGGAGCAHWNAC